MPNKRIFYASHAVSVENSEEPLLLLNNTIPGAQSVSINTNYNLEQIFQLGRLAIYDNFPANPEVEVTINKVLDGHPLIWNYFAGANSDSLQSASNKTSTIVLAVGQDNDIDGVIGPIESAITMTGCFVSSLNYTFPVDGNFTEELTFVGNHKVAGGTVSAPPADPDLRVVRRQNFRLDGEGADSSVLPSAIVGKCLQNVSISADLGRESIYCLGEYAPFHRYVNFPLEITVSFDVLQDGSAGTSLVGPDINIFEVGQCTALNINKEQVIIRVCRTSGEGVDIAYEFDLGSGCALQSVSYSGGDTGGGNVTETYTYIGYNELTITYTSN